MKNFAPAADRNKTVIGEALADVLPSGGLVLEVASGSGQHVVHFAAALPHLEFQPTDLSAGALASIGAYTAAADVANVRKPVALDATSQSWPVPCADAIVCINMIHVAPWAACLGLVAGAARTMSSGAPLVLYGPFSIDGEFDASSNAEFDQSLRRMDSSWGVRDLSAVDDAARARGFELARTIGMPANNLIVVFRKRA